MKKLHYGVLLIGICLSPLHSANATVDDTLEQIEDAAEDPLRPEKRSYGDRKFPPIRLTLAENIEWGDFDGTNVTSFRTTVTAEVRFPITKNYLAAVSTHVGITATDFQSGGQFINTGTGRTSSDPWDELHEFSLRYRSQYLINDRWGVMLAAWMVSRYEDGARFNDGLKGAGATGITYRLGKKFSMAAGVAVSSRIVGGGVSVNPFGQFTWNIDDRHSLSTAGLGLRFRTKWSDTLSTNIFGKFRGRRWRLDDQDDGLVNRGSLRDRQLPIGVGLQWKFLKGWRLNSELGLLAYRQYKVTDQDGNSVDTVTSDAPGVFGSLLVQWRF